MAQRDFSKNILTLEERNKRDTLIGRLNRLRQQEVINKTRPYDKNRDDILAKQIKDTQLQLGIDPESMATKPSLKNIKKGTDVKSKPNPVNNLGQNASLTTNTPSNRTTTKTSSRTNKNSGVKSKSLAGGKPNNREKLINLKGTFNTNKTTDENMPILKPRPNISESKNYSPRIQKMLEEQERQSLRRSANFQDEALSQDSLQAPSRQRLEDNIKNVDDNQDMNALEKLVSRIVGKNIRFEDIPEDDPFITDMPQNYQNLRRGGQVKRMGHGGAITPEQKKRISRIVQENKARKSKSTKSTATTPTATSSKKRAAPFSDMKKARMNGNKKRTNR